MNADDQILNWLSAKAADIRKRPDGRWQVLNYDGVICEGDSIQNAALDGMKKQEAEGRPHGTDHLGNPCECEECEEFFWLSLFLSTKEETK